MLPSSPVTIRCPLLIGRDDLLELVDRRLDDVEAGRGQFLLLAGEAGIGKTRFMGAIEHKAAARGMPIVHGSIAPQDQGVPAASILDFARTMTWDERFAEAGQALLRLADSTAASEHVRRRRLVMEAVELILGAFRRPAMLAFEDLQWADELSLEIIGELARQSRDRPLLLTADYRVEDVPPGTSLRDWRARLVTQRIAEEIRLQPLTKAETALVTTLILDTGLPAPREVTAAVYERTDGIPLHIEELLGALSAEAKADGKAILEATVPDTIDDAVMSRMGHRSSDAQAVARAGAVIGRCFAPDVLAGIMDVPVDDLDGPLRELVDHMVLTAPDPSNGYYDFRHQLLRDVLYRTIPLADRRRFHARAGEFGATLDGQSEVHASVHYERAGQTRKAFDAALAGARDAVRLSAHRESFDLYRRAVAFLPDELGEFERATILEAYAIEALAIEEHEIAENAFECARAAYLASGRRDRAAAALVGILDIWRREVRSAEARSSLATSMFEELRALGSDAERDIERGWVYEESVRTYLDVMQVDDARKMIARMRVSAATYADPIASIQADALAGMADVLDGRVVVGLAGIGAAARDARRAGFDDVAVTAYRDAATFGLRTMQYPSSEQNLDQGLRFADAIEQSHCMHVMGSVSALVAWADADWDRAITLARQSIADHGCRRASAIGRWAVGYVAMGRGDNAASSTDLSAALAVGEEGGTIDLILPPLWGLAEAALLAGDEGLAATICEDALVRAKAVGERALLVPFVVTGVRALHEGGRPGDAGTWLAACDLYLAVVPEVARPALDHGRGLIALAAGSTGIARQALADAVAGWDGLGRIWEATWARLDLANCYTRINRFSDAVALASDARAVASRLDSRPIADRAEAILRMARGHVSDEEPWRPLTAREFAVARLISEGLTNAEIAGELGIAPKTASSHVEHILAKLGASRRAEIAVWASRVEPSPAPR